MAWDLVTSDSSSSMYPSFRTTLITAKTYRAVVSSFPISSSSTKESLTIRFFAHKVTLGQLTLCVTRVIQWYLFEYFQLATCNLVDENTLDSWLDPWCVETHGAISSSRFVAREHRKRWTKVVPRPGGCRCEQSDGVHVHQYNTLGPFFLLFI